MESVRIKSGIPGLDQMLGGGFLKNSTVAVAGGTGSGRTIFVSQFLYKGAELGEPGLFLSFDHQKDSIYSHLAPFGWDFLAFERKQKIVFIEYPQNELTSFPEQESALHDLIDTLGIKRVVIDSITPYALMFNSQEERRLASMRLVNAVKGWKVTTLISSETVHGSEQTFPHTVSGVESFCDGFIVLSFARQGDRRSRAIEIVKMRGCKHEHEIRPAFIGESGFYIIKEESGKSARKRVVTDG
ncbi:MAG: ATPase domain-containing protein [Candidatus Anstonellaceae archaeon]